MATVKNTKINDTGFLKLPTGNTSQRPSTPVAGTIRYNNDNDSLDIFDGQEWLETPTYPAP